MNQTSSVYCTFDEYRSEGYRASLLRQGWAISIFTIVGPNRAMLSLTRVS